MPATVPIFVASALAVIPTAGLMVGPPRSWRAGPGVDGFLNVMFGNAAELIIALFELRTGLNEVVKASVVGSIVGNILLVLGVSMLLGGARRCQLGRSRRVVTDPTGRPSTEMS